MSEGVELVDSVVGSIRLHLQRCICGEHGVVTIIGQDGYAVQIKVYTFYEAQGLLDRLLDAGGEVQEQYQDELVRADYLVDDYYPVEITNLGALIVTLESWGKFQWEELVTQ